jgi:enoyl-CoA hydratase/carnithine racemase
VSYLQIEFGAVMPYSFAAILGYKLGSPKVVRQVCLEAKRFTGKELCDLGVIDVLAEDGTGVLKAARDLAAEKGKLANTGVWGLMKVSTKSRRLIPYTSSICVRAFQLNVIARFAEGSHACPSRDG